MDSGFSYGDIIIIGAIAAFILLRYRAMLGESHGRDPREPRTKPADAREFDRVIQLPAAKTIAPIEKKDDFGKQYGSLAETFVAMRGIDREFTPDEFMNGARMAYEMVLEAFSKGNRDTLKMLLSDTLYAQFDSTLKDDEAQNQKTETILVAIKKAELTDAKLIGNTATLTVDFVSEQIHLVRDKDGTIIEGDASREQKVEDQWVFTRNLTSSDLNWKIIET